MVPSLIRYKVIDKCLQQKGKQWNSKTLAEACGNALREKVNYDLANPSIRTIQGDIAVMRSDKLNYSAPIVWDPKRQTYYYEDSDYSISKFPLTDDDLEELRQSLHLLSQFKSFKDLGGLEQVVRKLELMIKKDSINRPPIILFETNTQAVGRGWIDPLYNFILDKKCIHILYKPFDFEEPYRRIISPYLIKEYNNRWFLIGYDHEESKVRTYGLDRIIELEHYLLKPFYETPAFHPEYYFKHIIGVSIPDGSKPEEVEILVTPEQANYIITKPLHPSQKRSHSNNLLFSYRLIINYELESLLLSFGEKVTVLAPQSLKEKVARRVALLKENYF
jgi:predicted DNA-binding transcriptional regulator YafY